MGERVQKLTNTKQTAVMPKKCMEKCTQIYRKFLNKRNLNTVEAEEAELLPEGYLYN